MTKREVGWAIYLVGLPFAPLLVVLLSPLGLLKIPDLWHMQTAFAYTGLLLLAACQFATPSLAVPNRPLAWWTGTIGVLAMGQWMTQILTKGIYFYPLLIAVVHLLAILIFYTTFTAQVSSRTLPRLFEGMGYSVLAMGAYSVLQRYQLDQFLKSFDGSMQMVGTLGNPNHLAAYLAIGWPLVWGEARWRRLACVALWCLIGVSGSAAAQLALAVSVLWAVACRAPRWALGLGVSLAALGGGVVWAAPQVLHDYGRFHAWDVFWHQFVTVKSITGWGPGFLGEWARTITDGHDPMFGWRHAHNEALQLWVEQGVLGLGLVVWLLHDTVAKAWTHRAQAPVWVAGTMLMAFLANSVLNFPAHLWATGSLALVALSSVWLVEADV